MWYDDIVVGERREFGRYTFDEAEMIAFARQYDPQPYHIDPEAARQSVFGGLIASGWLTAAVGMRLMLDSLPTDFAGHLVSPGFSNLKWQKPLRAGTTLIYSAVVTEKRLLRSRPGFGLVLSEREARDPDGMLYMSLTTKGIIARNPA